MQGSIKLNTSSLEASRSTLDVQRKVRPVEDWARSGQGAPSEFPKHPVPQVSAPAMLLQSLTSPTSPLP